MPAKLNRKYIICGKIGEGSFAEVLKAKRVDGNVTRYFAIKCMKRDDNAATTQTTATKKVPKKRDVSATMEGAPARVPSVNKSSTAAEADNNDSNNAGSDGNERNKKNSSSDDDDALLFECKEVFVLKMLRRHPNILRLYDAFRDPKTSRICIVTELMDMNMFEFLQTFHGEPVPEPLVRDLMRQALCGLAHCHARGFFHRDLKPENMLLYRARMTLKLADFGSCKETDSRPPYTEYIATRWYRAPECLLTNGHYSLEMDIWGLGCVMYELLTARPLFPGRDEAQQMQCIQRLLGPPPYSILQECPTVASSTLVSALPLRGGRGTQQHFERALRHVSFECVDLIKRMLVYVPTHRISAVEALRHPFFRRRPGDLSPICLSPMAPRHGCQEPKGAADRLSSQKQREAGPRRRGKKQRLSPFAKGAQSKGCLSHKIQAKDEGPRGVPKERSVVALVEEAHAPKLTRGSFELRDSLLTCRDSDEVEPSGGEKKPSYFYYTDPRRTHDCWPRGAPEDYPNNQGSSPIQANHEPNPQLVYVNSGDYLSQSNRGCYGGGSQTSQHQSNQEESGSCCDQPSYCHPPQEFSCCYPAQECCYPTQDFCDSTNQELITNTVVDAPFLPNDTMASQTTVASSSNLPPQVTPSGVVCKDKEWPSPPRFVADFRGREEAMDATTPTLPSPNSTIAATLTSLQNKPTLLASLDSLDNGQPSTGRLSQERFSFLSGRYRRSRVRAPLRLFRNLRSSLNCSTL